MEEEQQIELVSSFHSAKLQLYRRDPLLWYTERLLGGEEITDPEEKKEHFRKYEKHFKWSKYKCYEEFNHEWDGDIDPLWKAWQTLAEVAFFPQQKRVTKGEKREIRQKWVCLTSGTGTGKTYWASRVILWFLDCWNNSKIICVGPKQEQIKANLWDELRKVYQSHFHRMYPNSNIWETSLQLIGNQSPEEIAANKPLKKLGRVLISGTSAGVDDESTPRMRGFHDEHMLFVLDECNGIDAAVIDAIAQTSVSDHNLILALGNPDFHDDQLMKFSRDPQVKSFRVSSLDNPNYVSQESLIPGVVTFDSVESIRTKHGEESHAFVSKIRGMVPSLGSAALFQEDILRELFELSAKGSKDLEGTRVLGVDTANSSSGDPACVAYLAGNTYYYIKEFLCPSANDLSYNLVMEKEEFIPRGIIDYDIPTIMSEGIKPYNVGVDAIGVGVTTTDNLMRMGYKCTCLNASWRPEERFLPIDEDTSKPLWRFQNLRAQMVWLFSEAVRKKEVRFQLPDSGVFDKLVKELTALTYVLGPSGTGVTPKDKLRAKIGRSTNVADAVIYAYYMKMLSKRQVSVSLPAGEIQKKTTSRPSRQTGRDFSTASRIANRLGRRGYVRDANHRLRRG